MTVAQRDPVYPVRAVSIHWLDARGAQLEMHALTAHDPVERAGIYLEALEIRLRAIARELRAGVLLVDGRRCRINQRHSSDIVPSSRREFAARGHARRFE